MLYRRKYAAVSRLCQRRRAFSAAGLFCPTGPQREAGRKGQTAGALLAKATAGDEIFVHLARRFCAFALPLWSWLRLRLLRFLLALRLFATLWHVAWDVRAGLSRSADLTRFLLVRRRLDQGTTDRCGEERHQEDGAEPMLDHIVVGEQLAGRFCRAAIRSRF